MPRLKLTLSTLAATAGRTTYGIDEFGLGLCFLQVANGLDRQLLAKCRYRFRSKLQGRVASEYDGAKAANSPERHRHS